MLCCPVPGHDIIAWTEPPVGCVPSASAACDPPAAAQGTPSPVSVALQHAALEFLRTVRGTDELVFSNKDHGLGTLCAIKGQRCEGAFASYVIGPGVVMVRCSGASHPDKHSLTLLGGDVGWSACGKGTHDAH
eukprot:gene47966-66497_t